MTIVLGGLRVTASNHAVDQAEVRVLLLRGANRGQATHWVEKNAAKGIAAGRTAKTMPRWCVIGKIRLPKRSKTTAAGTYRFVWNEWQTAVFMVVKAHENDHPAGAGWLVMTTMVPPVRDVVAA